MRFRWADCELDREERALRRAGRPVRIQALVLDLLLLLLEQRGRVVSEDFLRRRLWRDVHVGDASLRRLVKEARRAIGDDGATQAQLQTVRGRGLRFAAPVAIDDGWDTSFVGRSDVLEALDRKLEEVAGGLGGLTLVHGPAGIGKTRTLAEVESRAALRGFRVLHGSGRAEAEGDAFHPWLDVARELGIDAILPGDPDAAGVPIDAAGAAARRYAGFRSVSKVLSRIARERPILIALDDLQLADRDGLEALRFLAPAMLRARVWLVGAYRTGGGARTEDALRALAALGAESSTQDLPLRGFTADELATLLARHMHTEVGAGLAARLSDRAGGNPLFALEIARSLQRDGASLAGDPGSGLDAKLAQGIEPLLARRLSAIPAEALRVLCAASAIGDRFDPAIVEAAEGMPPGGAAAGLDACASAGLVEPDAHGAWRFAHPLVAEAVYARLESGQHGGAAAQHARIADACLRSGAADPFLLAHQFSKARPIADAATVLAHVHSAARTALQRAALADAQYWYREAIALADESRVTGPLLYDLLMENGATLLSLGGAAAARPSYERAAQLALAEGDRERLTRAVLAFAHRPLLVEADARVLHWLRTARDAGCDDPGLRARVAGRLGSELMYAGAERAAEARAFVDEAVAAARRIADANTLGSVLLDRAMCEFSPRDTRAWIALLEEVERHGRAANDRELEFRGLYSRATGWLELGDRARVEAVHRASRGFVRDQLGTYALAVTRGIDGMLALLDGRWADARTRIEEAERNARATSGVGIALAVGAQRILLTVESGGAASTLPLLDQIAARHPGLLSAVAFRGLVRALCGDVGGARAALAQFVDGLPALPFDRNRLPALAIAAELAGRVRAAEAATVLERELAPFAHLGAVLGNVAFVYFGSVAHALGWTAAARGDVRGAVAQFQRGLAVHEALRSPPWCARSEAAISEVRALRVVGGPRG